MKRTFFALAALVTVAAPALAAAQPAPDDRAERRDQRVDTRQIDQNRAAVQRSDAERTRQVDANRNAVDRSNIRRDQQVGADRAAVARNNFDRRAVFDRSRPNWWRGRPEFSGYNGYRQGAWFIPGYGYRPVPAGYWNYRWVTGGFAPGLFFRDSAYFVSNPWAYGVQPPPYGYRWIYLGPNLALVNVYNGRIVRLVPNIF